MSEAAVVVQYAAGRSGVPSALRIRRWAGSALRQVGRECASLTVRIVGESEGRELNARYRHVDRATNVLAFPLDLPAGVACEELGDVVVCAPVISEEADRYGIPRDARWAHMVVHGVLHLCGLDHTGCDDAAVMERQETSILAGLGFPDPYA